MTVKVYWFRGCRGQWCHGILQAFFAGKLWPLPDGLTFEHVPSLPTEPTDFGIVILPGAWIHDKELYREVQDGLDFLGKALVIHSGDEEVVMRSETWKSPERIVLMQAPRPGRKPDGFILYGWPEDTRDILGQLGSPLAADLRSTWSFCGQINHEHREDFEKQMANREDYAVTVTSGFAGSTRGVSRAIYASGLATSRVIPCPSGPQSPETFRLYEALEAGCIPIAQRRAPAGGWPEGFDYWTWRYGSVPFPTVEKWSEAHPWLDLYRDPVKAQEAMTRCSAWWQMQKRAEALDMVDYIDHLAGPIELPRVTIIITSSPGPRTEDLTMLEDCIRRIRGYPELRESDILLCLDGVREDLSFRRDSYREYCRQVVDRCNWDPEWFGVLPLVMDEWVHQAEMAKRALALVRTPLILFVEHDTFPMGAIPWAELIGAFVQSAAWQDRVECIRLHIFDHVLDEHSHLYGHYYNTRETPLIATRQWSQRPHLARAQWYRDLLKKYFPDGTKAFIEDTLVSPTEGGEISGLFVYAPSGSMLRSGTVDGRGSDPKAPWRAE